MILHKHSFPNNFIQAMYNRNIMRLLDGDDITVFDCTWARDDAFKLYSAEEFICKHLVLISNLDPASMARIDQILSHFTYKDVTIINNIATPNYSFWGYYSFNVFKEQFGKDFNLDFKHRYLAYNRKPHRFRVKLVQSLIDANLDQFGILTLGGNIPITIDENANIPNRNVTSEVGIPNDIMSLGDKNIWDSCFLNVVTETVTGEGWVSEKTFKPLIGKRPFFLVQATDTRKKLKEWGFKTFSDYWNEDDQLVDVVAYLCNLPDSEIVDMYKDMQPILDHNHHHFFTDYQTYNNTQLNNIINNIIV